MRIFLNILGILIILAGGVWFLQGVNVLPGSFMTGEFKWAVYGGIVIVIGIGMLVYANLKKSASPRTKK
jgi:hypothetical protein